MKENIKAWAIGGYFIIGFFFTVYQNLWGQYSYKSSAYIGRGIVWPAVMFPSVGKFYWWRNYPDCYCTDNT